MKGMVAVAVLLLCSITTSHAAQSIYSVRSLADMTWLADDDATPLSTSQIYQMENAASTFFKQVLMDWLLDRQQQDEEQQQQQDALSTTVAIRNQIVELTDTGERLRLSLPSTVDFMYIGTQEISSITQVLTNLTKEYHDSPAYFNMQTLAGANPPTSFSITFSDPVLNASTLLYTVEDTTDTAEADSNGNSGQTGLIIACIFASLSLFLASLILLWAVGAFDGCRPCKKLRSRFYMVSPRADGATKDRQPDVPYGITSKSTEEEAEDPEDAAAPAVGIHYGAKPKDGDEEAGMHCEGIEMTPSRGIFHVYSEYSDELLSPGSSSQVTELSNYSEVSGVGPLGIAALREVQRATSEPTAKVEAAMTAEAILADIGSLPIDLD